MHTAWDVLAEHCKLFVAFGGVPHKNAQINAGGASVHHVKGGLYGMRAKRRALRQRHADRATISTPAATSNGWRSGPTPTPR